MNMVTLWIGIHQLDDFEMARSSLLICGLSGGREQMDAHATALLTNSDATA